MSIRSEIERINSIKERIRTNLVAQGLVVPEDSVLAEMAEQILSVAGIPATHSWNGTVLTVTSASGTSSADLKGDDYVLTEADKAEIAQEAADLVDVDRVVRVTEQTFTDTEKAQARENIGAASTSEIDQLSEEIANSMLPTVTSDDAGKFLRVSSEGKWIAESLRNAEEVAY